MESVERAHARQTATNKTENIRMKRNSIAIPYGIPNIFFELHLYSSVYL